MKGNTKSIIFYLVLIVALLAVASLLFRTGKETVKYSEIINYFKNNEVVEFEVGTDSKLTMKVKLTDGTTKNVSYGLNYVTKFFDDVEEYVNAQMALAENDPARVLQSYNIEEPTVLPWWVSFLPYVIIIAVFIGLWVYFMRQATGGKGSRINSFSRARTKLGADEKNKVFFSDVAGADEEKEELTEVVDFLRDPEKFRRLGARIPRGVLLVGPPGTGKTLLAKAVAGEAGVPFYSISGSDFVEMYVGVGASRVRDLFDTARKNNASIIFIDEIDAVGRHRGAGLGGGHDEREQTLNQLLVEMDGFGNHEGVIVMAATNRPDILDPALLRPGRFDRQVTVNYPDIDGREAILKVHSKKKPLATDVDLAQIARTTVGFTGADLANLLNEAAISAAKKGESLISMADIEEATTKVLVGNSKKSKKRNEKDIRLTAFHEAGHAVVTHLLETQDPVQQISIIPTTKGAGGYTLSSPIEDRMYMSKTSMFEEIVSLVGGRVAESLVMGDISTGASNDIQRATDMARAMVTRYGMSDKLGPIVYGTGHGSDEVFLGRDFSSGKDYSDATAKLIDDEIKSIIESAYAKAEEILKANEEKLSFVAEFLIKHEAMDGDQFKAAMNGDGVTEDDLVRMAAERKRRVAEENAERKRREEEKKKEEEKIPPHESDFRGL